MKLQFFGYLLSLGVLLFCVNVVNSSRQGGLLQPSGAGGGTENRPAPTHSPGSPSRGQGSGQSLLQPFSGNVYNSYSGSKGTSSSGTSGSTGPSQGNANTDYAIEFQNTGSRGPKTTRAPPGASPIQPAFSGAALSSGSSLLGQSAPSGEKRPPTSTSSSQFVAPSGSAGASGGFSSGLLGQSGPTREKRPTTNSTGSTNVNLNLGGYAANKSPDGDNQAQSVEASRIVVWLAALLPLVLMLMANQTPLSSQ